MATIANLYPSRLANSSANGLPTWATFLRSYSKLIIGIINILVDMILSALSFPHIKIEDLQYVDFHFVNGQKFNPKILERILGVFGCLLWTYFCWKCGESGIALRSRRQFPDVWKYPAMMTVIALFILWLFAVNGSITHLEPGSATGTVLALLAGKPGGTICPHAI